MKKYCGNPSRGSNPLAMRSAEEVFSCRLALSDMFGCSPEGVVFTHNTTYALNMAIKGVMRHGGHMIISNLEHNATLRPAARLEHAGLIAYGIYDAYGKDDGELLRELDQKVRADTKAICAIHTSNICSYTLPIAKIGAFCRERGLLFICDGAQSGGHTDIDMRRDNIDILCLPAHKGLYGPQGLGIMLLSDKVLSSDTLPDTLIEGGNGVNSLELFMGDTSPERYEAGTVNTPAIVGLRRGIEFLRKKGLENIAAQYSSLFGYAADALSSIRGIRLCDNHHGSTLLFNIPGLPSDEVGRMLSEEGICVRTGFHCAPLAHRALGTGDGGAVRVSFGIFNTRSDVDTLADLCEKISCSVR